MVLNARCCIASHFICSWWILWFKTGLLQVYCSAASGSMLASTSPVRKLHWTQVTDWVSSNTLHAFMCMTTRLYVAKLSCGAMKAAENVPVERIIWVTKVKSDCASTAYLVHEQARVQACVDAVTNSAQACRAAYMLKLAWPQPDCHPHLLPQNCLSQQDT